ncbi:hypothetical protein AWZ03_012547 [Drosophila navojoa]|uniref:Uncharacterized protein n=1 Tax=Drosophila navojoa TaxID=7232 RepID=A0A484AX99_DRONA|nr:hypothetical protein AWZ03_012547 [Drosophila navojoa]
MDATSRRRRSSSSSNKDDDDDDDEKMRTLLRKSQPQTQLQAVSATAKAKVLPIVAAAAVGQLHFGPQHSIVYLVLRFVWGPSGAVSLP